MKSTPFLAQIPQKLMNDPEIRGFFEYLINYISDVQRDSASNETELSQQLNEIYSNDYDLEITDNDNSDDLIFVNGAQYRSTIVSGGYGVILANDFVTASGGAFLSLQTYASDNDMIKIANTDGSEITIVGSLSTTGGATQESKIISYTQGAIYDFQYNASKKRWVLV